MARFSASALIVALVWGTAACAGLARTGSAAQVQFDLPESIECRDVTPPDFTAREYLKVIEGRLRISARVTDGSEADVVDFLYTITSPERTVRFQDYLPNTTLESAVANDLVEVNDATEKAKATTADVHVVYKLLAIGASHSQNSKQSEASRYTQIAQRELVVASGTIEREHGVFYRLRPSRAASLEGAKEFTFLATVPRSWRGDVSTIHCQARTRKSSIWSNSVAPAGGQKALVGLYLASDMEAASLAQELFRLQEAQLMLARVPAPKESVFETVSNYSIGHFVSKKSEPNKVQLQLREATQAVADVQSRLKELAR